MQSETQKQEVSHLFLINSAPPAEVQGKAVYIIIRTQVHSFFFRTINLCNFVIWNRQANYMRLSLFVHVYMLVFRNIRIYAAHLFYNYHQEQYR